MFTGIVQALGIVIAVSETEAGKRFTVSLAELAEEKLGAGDSVCVSGVCLTAVKVANGNCSFDVITETLRRSTLGGKIVADRVNLEMSLRPDSYVGGHFVQGHVDAVGTIREVQNKAEDWRIIIGVPAEVMGVMVPKGSVAVDGVSMTVAEVDVEKNTFTIAVIPTTLEKTTLSGLAVGQHVNVETDILARTVVHWMELQAWADKGGRNAKAAKEAKDPKGDGHDAAAVVAGLTDGVAKLIESGLKR